MVCVYELTKSAVNPICTHECSMLPEWWKRKLGDSIMLCGFYHSIHYLTWQLRSDFIRSSSHGARSHDPGRELLQVAPRRRWWDWIIPWIVVFQPGWSQVLKIQWTMSCYKWLKRTLVSNHLINLDDQEIYVYLCIYIYIYIPIIFSLKWYMWIFMIYIYIMRLYHLYVYIGIYPSLYPHYMSIISQWYLHQLTWVHHSPIDVLVRSQENPFFLVKTLRYNVGPPSDVNVGL